MREGRRDWTWLTVTLVASDLGAVLLAFWLAATLVWRTGVGINGGNDSDWLVLAMVPVLGLIFFRSPSSRLCFAGLSRDPGPSPPGR